MIKSNMGIVECHGSKRLLDMELTALFAAIIKKNTLYTEDELHEMIHKVSTSSSDDYLIIQGERAQKLAETFDKFNELLDLIHEEVKDNKE